MKLAQQSILMVEQASRRAASLGSAQVVNGSGLPALVAPFRSVLIDLAIQGSER